MANSAHEYRGASNSRAQRTRSKLRGVRPIALRRLEILTRGLPCSICGVLVPVVRVVETPMCAACTQAQA